ncbi:hypothetical protein DER46DRAFT_670649 [Fusarium sp. MPI-SDFR-AT-0072]|nr:hypothetical protein DER46DRAFT_670649 [Fusarium sp. MPI-SDFR-AT-0072]
MALNCIKSYRPGYVVIDNVNIGNGPLSDCDRFQGSFAGELPGVEYLEPLKPRRMNSIAFLLEVEKLTCGPHLNIAIYIISICGDPEALMAYMVKNPGLIPSWESFKGGEVGKRRREIAEIINGAWRSCIKAGNRMGEGVTAANIQCAEDLFIADVIIANPPSMAYIYCMEKLSILLYIVFTMPWLLIKAFPYPLAAISYRDANTRVANYFSFIITELLTWQGQGYQLLLRLRVLYSYLWSKSLLPKLFDWPSYLNITGFSFLPLAHLYMPPPDLVEFLETGLIPIYGGVSVGGDVLDGVYLIGNYPHDWLFQRVSVVIHHGSAGTTAAGIAADQPISQMVARAGAGLISVLFKELTVEILAEMDKLRCDICPERLATWLHRKTGAHLSGFTASYLKLLRHKHWYVDNGAEELITGVIAAASGFLAAVGTAMSDYLQRLKNPALLRPLKRRLSSKRHFTPTEEHQAHRGILRPIIGPAALTPMEIENIAIRLATKSLRNGDLTIAASNIAPSIRNRHKASWRAHKEGKNGRAYYIAHATGRYICDLVNAGAKAPVALIYNITNGFYNALSHGFAGIEVRWRDKITGLGSGLNIAGKEFTLPYTTPLSTAPPFRQAKKK